MAGGGKALDKASSPPYTLKTNQTLEARLSTKKKTAPKIPPKVPVKAKAKGAVKAAVKAAAPKAATKKKTDDGGRLVNVKVWPAEKKIIAAKAKAFTDGNVSAWLRFAALTCVPSKADQARLKAGEY